MNITRPSEDIIRIIIPFLDIDTAVFLVRLGEEYLLFDTATYDTDMTELLFPCLSELGIPEEALTTVFISHPHRDHAGGLGAVLARYPTITVLAGGRALLDTHKAARLSLVRDGDRIGGVLRVVALPGHTADAVALLDTRTGILLSGDGLQLSGIFGSGWWGANITLPRAHKEALDRLSALPITAIYPAHDYHPEGRAYIGREAIARAIAACHAPLDKIREMILAAPGADDKAIAAAYNQEPLPTLGWPVVAAVRRELL